LHGWNAVIDAYILFRKDRPARQGGGVPDFIPIFKKENIQILGQILGMSWRLLSVLRRGSMEKSVISLPAC